MSSKQIIRVMQVLTWVAFIGACIKAGALLVAFIAGEVVSPAASANLYRELDLSAVRQQQYAAYIGLTLHFFVITAVKAWLLYNLIEVFAKLNLMHPFSQPIQQLLTRMSLAALVVGLGEMVASKYVQHLSAAGIPISNHDSFTGGAEEYLLLAGIVFTIAQVFRRGIEIQSEHELTV